MRALSALVRSPPCWTAALGLATAVRMASSAVAASTTTTATCKAPAPALTLTTWNIAAVNNNPFEYWLTYDADPRYASLMDGVQRFIEAPGEADVRVDQVFRWYDDLEKAMAAAGVADVEELRETRMRWISNLAGRKIVSQFLKDPEIGAKRLASMPDRITNTMQLSPTKTIYRPTAINCYGGRFSSADDWWSQWRSFMFDPNPDLKDKQPVVKLLKKIPRAKYPELTESDERISVPLQIVCQAVFDAILYSVLEAVSGTGWQDLRSNMCMALNAKKNDRIVEILETQYAAASDVITLQEVAGSFVERAQQLALGNKFHFFSPTSMKAKGREQNSVVLLSKSKFDVSKAVDVSDDVAKLFEGKVPVDDGDLLAVRVPVVGAAGKPDMLVASFHGDTDGLATIPVLRALHKYASASSPSLRLVFGLDANAYDKFKAGKQLDVREFARVFREELGMTSCFGDSPDPSRFTTYNARTYLQPQLNKAVKASEIRAKGDVNPKDFILVYKSQFAFQEGSVVRDNTGKREYKESMVFPTLEFPSDHGVVSAVVVEADAEGCGSGGGAAEKARL